jgi:hypothetical protein
MKPLVIGVLGGGVVIAVIVAVLVTQNMTTMQIQEDIKRQELLDLNLDKCDLDYAGLSIFGKEDTTSLENCYESSIMTFGNDEQKKEWEFNSDYYISELQNVEPNPCGENLYKLNDASYSGTQAKIEQIRKCTELAQERSDKIPHLRDYVHFRDNVLDCSKESQHYADRYNNEITYKEWFDENYHNLSMKGMDYLTTSIEVTCSIRDQLPNYGSP